MLVVPGTECIVGHMLPMGYCAWGVGDVPAIRLGRSFATVPKPFWACCFLNGLNLREVRIDVYWG